MHCVCSLSHFILHTRSSDHFWRTEVQQQWGSTTWNTVIVSCRENSLNVKKTSDILLVLYTNSSRCSAYETWKKNPISKLTVTFSFHDTELQLFFHTFSYLTKWWHLKCVTDLVVSLSWCGDALLAHRHWADTCCICFDKRSRPQILSNLKPNHTWEMETHTALWLY